MCKIDLKVSKRKHGAEAMKITSDVRSLMKGKSTVLRNKKIGGIK